MTTDCHYSTKSTYQIALCTFSVIERPSVGLSVCYSLHLYA